MMKLGTLAPIGRKGDAKIVERSVVVQGRQRAEREPHDDGHE